MAATALTETSITKAVREATAEGGTRRDLRDPGHAGLWLRIGTTGTKTWALRARAADGKPHWFTLGYHPKMGLSDARHAATAMLVTVRNGGNPIEERRAAREAQRAEETQEATPDPEPVNTLKTVLALYERQRGGELKSWDHSRKRIDRVFAGVLSRSVASLTAADLQLIADAYPAQQSAAFAVRTLRPVLKWAAKRNYCDAALADLEQPAPVRRRQRILSRGELAALLPVLGDGPEAHGACLRFILLTACRLTEATEARWRDIDWQRGLWTIPQTKSGQEHVVPLSRQALALLRRRQPEMEPDDLVFASEAGSRLTNWDRVTKQLLLLAGLAKLTDTGGVVMKDASPLPHRHDLRRTAATLMGEIGVEPHVIEAALGHVTVHSGLASIYNRSRYRAQVADALQRLADLLDTIEQGDADKVVPLHAAARA